MVTTLIGIDAATNPAKTGVVRAEYGRRSFRLTDARVLQELGEDVLTGWLKESARSLIAVDAPLGWPRPLATSLVDHAAGEPLHENPNRLFRRSTDRFVKELVGKQSLDVGADRIARTAHAALGLIDSLRHHSELDLPMAWEPCGAPRARVIEVYPAATLRTRGWSDEGYKNTGTVSKRASARVKRENLVAKMSELIDMNGFEHTLVDNDDLLDGALCALAGADFLSGDAVCPENLPEATLEGWIWVKRPCAIGNNRR